MNPPPIVPTQRLERLLAFLREDPANPRLLAEAWDEAMASGDLACAASVVRSGLALGVDADGWAQREARLAIAQADWIRAHAALDRAESLGASRCELLHDRGIVLFGQGHYEACASQLAIALDTCRGGDDAFLASMRLWWIRANHRAGKVHEAFAWICAASDARALHPCWLAPASLLALDAGDFPRARALSDGALAADRMQAEALVARACVAVAERDAHLAATLLADALVLGPEDGRTWSALGMARLQAGDIAGARTAFERATRSMPAHIGTWHGLGWACVLLQDREAALAAFERALALNRNFAESHGALGLVLSLTGRADEAEAHIALADRLDRQNVTGRFARAVATGEGRDAKAMEALVKRLLDRPGLFGGPLSDNVLAQTRG